MKRTLNRSWKREVFEGVVLILGLLGVRSSLADQYVVPTGSMEPTILPGDHILVDKRAYDLRTPFSGARLLRTGEPRRGDVIVFDSPEDPSTTLVKRVVGVPGDRVRVVDGRVWVNDRAAPLTPEGRLGTVRFFRERLGDEEHRLQRLEQARGLGPPTHPSGVPGPQEFLVPADHYFFLGDNRDNSRDSRTWGLAPRSALRGRAWRVIRLGWQPLASSPRSPSS
jgi:signal peptidase I